MITRAQFKAQSYEETHKPPSTGQVETIRGVAKRALEQHKAPESRKKHAYHKKSVVKEKKEKPSSETMKERKKEKLPKSYFAETTPNSEVQDSSFYYQIAREKYRNAFQHRKSIKEELKSQYTDQSPPPITMVTAEVTDIDEWLKTPSVKTGNISRIDDKHAIVTAQVDTDQLDDLSRNKIVKSLKLSTRVFPTKFNRVLPTKFNLTKR